MRLFRMYTGSDGQSHLEQIAIPSGPEPQPATGVRFHQMVPTGDPPGGWHTSPNRHYVINLAGAVEIGLGDGSLHRFGAGDCVLAEDTTGQGHTTRALGNEPRIFVTIPLKD
jgi:hypothetical protein